MNRHLEPEHTQPTARGEALDAASKKRKVTYWARKDETCQLRQEVEALHAELAVLKDLQAPATADHECVAPDICKALIDQRMLEETARRVQLQVARGQAMLSQFSGDQKTHPLYTRICLSKDWEERRATFMAMRMQKLHNAYHFAMARCGSLDQSARRSDNRFETDQGDIDYDRCDIQVFEWVKSLQQVFDAVMFYMTNMEISLSERLGYVAVRDDYDVEEGIVHNSRVIIRNSNGVVIESSAVAFPHVFAEGDPAFGGEPCAILTVDCVDEDELYPYVPSERLRRDASTAVVLTVSKHNPQSKPENQTGSGGTAAETSGNGEESELVDVMMRRAGYMRLHRPEFPMSDGALQDLRDGIAGWGEIMLKTIREIVYLQR